MCSTEEYTYDNQKWTKKHTRYFDKLCMLNWESNFIPRHMVQQILWLQPVSGFLSLEGSSFDNNRQRKVQEVKKTKIWIVMTN